MAQNIQEIWDTMKSLNLRITEIAEGEESQIKDTENIFNKIKGENSPNIKEMPIKVQDAYRTPNRLVQKKKSPWQIITKILKVQNQEKNTKSCKERRTSHM